MRLFNAGRDRRSTSPLGPRCICLPIHHLVHSFKDAGIALRRHSSTTCNKAAPSTLFRLHRIGPHPCTHHGAMMHFSYSITRSFSTSPGDWGCSGYM
jgi:hypothetical protein